MMTFHKLWFSGHWSKDHEDILNRHMIHLPVWKKNHFFFKQNPLVLRSLERCSNLTLVPDPQIQVNTFGPWSGSGTQGSWPHYSASLTLNVLLCEMGIVIRVYLLGLLKNFPMSVSCARICNEVQGSQMETASAKLTAEHTQRGSFSPAWEEKSLIFKVEAFQVIISSASKCSRFLLTGTQFCGRQASHPLSEVRHWSWRTVKCSMEAPGQAFCFFLLMTNNAGSVCPWADPTK